MRGGGNFPLFELISHYSLSRTHGYCTNTAKLDQRSCIALLKSCRSMAHLKQIHAQMFRVGIHQSPDAVKKLMAFCADPSHGSLRYSETVFDYIRDPCLLIYNLMIKAFAKKGCFRKALSLFAKLRGDGLSPDNFTYPFVFKATACLGEVLEGAKVHGFVVKSGLEFDTYVCNSIMDMHAELGNIECMKKVFEEMPDRDVVAWNVMISGYVRCGKFDDAINFFCRMRQCSDLKPDEATVVSTLSACAALKNLELGEEIHCYVNEKLGYTTLIIGNALLDMYCKCGCLSIARKFFDEMPGKNVICWTTMVSGYVNCGQLDEAKKLFERSPARDIVLWTSMINGYVQFNRFDEAVALFREMQVKRVKPDKFTVVALLTGCAQLGALEQGKWIHEYVDNNQILMDAVLGTAIVNMYAKCGCIEKALEIFYSLREKDTASWTSIICGLAMNGKTNEALKLFSEMERLGARPDDITFIGVLSACSHGGLVDKGRKLFDSMKHVYQIKPKLEHYGCLIDLLGRAGILDEAEELIKKIPDPTNEVVVPLYGALLSACRIYGNVGIGERVARHLVNLGVRDSSVLTLLGNIYASVDRWEDVTKARMKMKEIGVRKFPGCSSIEINGIIYEFLVGDSSHPEIREICSMLHGIAKPSSGSEQNEMEDENLFSVGFL